MKHIINGQEYDVIVNRKFNRHTYIRVKDSKTIALNTSLFTSEKTIRETLKKHEDKIIKMLNKTVKSNNDAHKFYYLGSIYDIIMIPTISEVTIDLGNIYTKDKHTLDKWLSKEMISLFDQRYKLIYNLFEEKIPLYKLTIRKMKTRWGVCNRRSHKITLNSNLIKYDVATIDYVIIHELAHLVHFNHSKDFWSLVSKYCPDYKRIRKSLRE